MSILRVDMSRKSVRSQALPKEKILGGRALVDYLLTEYGSPTAHPLSRESLFVVAPGLLAGTGAPQSGRLSVGAKSPLTEGSQCRWDSGSQAWADRRHGDYGCGVE
jgi:aldehyde:ferredoxin oxidoreductase